MNNILTEWVRRDDTAPAPYLEKLPPGPGLDSAATHYAGLLAARAPARAIAWAQNVAHESTRQAALVSAASAWAQSEPAAATLWAATQNPATLPLDGLTGPFSYWLLHDAPAAVAWLATAPLPPETKAKLQPK